MTVARKRLEGASTLVSVAILTHNGAAWLPRLLKSVHEQATNHTVEVVAIDSGSTDGTLDVLDRFHVRVERIAPSDFDFGATRDQLFTLTKGAFILSLSQDAIPANASWLESMLAPFADPNVAVTCGRSIVDPDRRFPPFPWEANGYFYFTREMTKFRARHGRGLSNANAAYRRSVWEALRFGSQPIGEDFRFLMKLNEHGHRVAFVDNAPVLHHHTYTLRSLYKRCRNEGFGLRLLDAPYTEADLIRDWASPRKYRVWAEALLRGQLRTPAALAFPWLRPCAVYVGSRFGRAYLK